MCWTLPIYLDRTTTLFRVLDALFVSHSKHSLGKKVSKATIACWAKQCISKAYKTLGQMPLKVIMAATVAFSTRVSVEEICRTATWA